MVLFVTVDLAYGMTLVLVSQFRILSLVCKTSLSDKTVICALVVGDM
jgi:hypothetical protein